MDKQKWLLLGMLAVLVVALFLLSVAIGSGGGEADPEDSGGIESLDDLLGAIPGLGSSLDADDVDTDPDCFNRLDEQFVLDEAGPTSCRLEVDDGVDRVRLQYVVAGCSVEVSGQDDAIDHTVDVTDADDEGKLRIGLTGGGAELRFELGAAADGCVVKLL